MTTFVDSNVLIDVFTADPAWAGWSEGQLRLAHRAGGLVINAIVYAEVSIGFPAPDALDRNLADLGCEMVPFSREAAFLAGQAFARRPKAGQRSTILPDFLIGAHAAVLKLPLLTRNGRDFRTAFPTLRLVSPGPTA